MVGQVAPQNDCAVGVLVVATSTPLLVMYWKQVTARTDETEVGVAVAARQPVGHTLHVPASHRYVRHGETAGQAVVRDTQPVPHATGGTAWPVLARHVAMLVTVPAVPQLQQKKKVASVEVVSACQCSEGRAKVPGACGFARPTAKLKRIQWTYVSWGQAGATL